MKRLTRSKRRLLTNWVLQSMLLMQTGREYRLPSTRSIFSRLNESRSIFGRSIKCLLMNARDQLQDSKNTMEHTLVTMRSGLSGFSSVWASWLLVVLSSFPSANTTTGFNHLLFPSWLMVHNLGTINPLMFGNSAKYQWVTMFCCQSRRDEYK